MQAWDLINGAMQNVEPPADPQTTECHRCANDHNRYLPLATHLSFISLTWCSLDAQAAAALAFTCSTWSAAIRDPQDYQTDSEVGVIVRPGARGQRSTRILSGPIHDSDFH